MSTATISENLSRATGPAAPQVDDLVQILDTYNHLTERLQRTHETLTAEVQRLREQLDSANAALVRSQRLAALGEMAAGIAHEVRNPLACIQLYASMMVEDLADRPDQRETSRKIVAAVQGLEAIVCDVLTFASEMKVQCVPAPIRPTLESAVQTLRPLIEMHRTRILYAGDDALTAMHDPQLLQRALVNLIRNGIEAMAPGGTLTLGAAHEGRTLTLTVRDSGPGIGDEAIDRIFNPFFTTRPTGTGLGLAIVHRIVDAHGGTISVRNDGGAVFTLCLRGGQAA